MLLSVAKSLNKQDGFSLAELMIVVAIIGILSSLAVPQFQRFQAKAKQSEAKTNLNQIYTLQEAYYGDNDQYYNGWGLWGPTISPIGFATLNGRYSYSTASAPGYFVVGAVANNPNAIRAGCSYDSWWTDSSARIWPAGDCAVDP